MSDLMKSAGGLVAFSAIVWCGLHGPTGALLALGSLLAVWRSGRQTAKGYGSDVIGPAVLALDASGAPNCLTLTAEGEDGYIVFIAKASGDRRLQHLHAAQAVDMLGEATR